jgi:hypothetical protein
MYLWRSIAHTPDGDRSLCQSEEPVTPLQPLCYTLLEMVVWAAE